MRLAEWRLIMSCIKWTVLLLAGVQASYLNTTPKCYTDPRCQGDRQVIVHLFEWPWADIAEECESYLGPKVGTYPSQQT